MAELSEVIDGSSGPETLRTTYLTGKIGDLSILVSGDSVDAGDPLYVVDTLGIEESVVALYSGAIISIDRTLDNRSVDAGTPVLAIEHKLTPDEIEEIIEERTYDFVRAEMTSAFYITPDQESPPFIQVGDTITAGQTIALMDQQKTFIKVVYEGPDATVKKIYFQNNERVETGGKLLGVVPL